MSLSPRRERFCVAIAGGRTGQEAYAEAFGAARGARASAARLLTNATVQARIATIRQQIAAELLPATVAEVNSRIHLLQKRSEMLREVVSIRAAEYRGIEELASLVDPDTCVVKDLAAFEGWRQRHPRLGLGIENNPGAITHLLGQSTPEATTGLLLRDYRGKNAEQIVFKLDAALLSEMRAIEEQAARHLGQLRGDAPAGGMAGIAVQVNVQFVEA